MGGTENGEWEREASSLSLIQLLHPLGRSAETRVDGLVHQMTGLSLQRHTFKFGVFQELQEKASFLFLIINKEALSETCKHT